MSWISRLAAFGVFVVAIGAARVASAQEIDAPGSSPAAEDEIRERAKRLFERGADAFAKRNNLEAIYAFEQAYALIPNPMFLYNIGLAHEDMGNAGLALKAFRQYLREKPDDSDADEVNAKIDRLQARLALLGVQQVTVISEPPGSTVLIGGVVVGTSPWTGELPPGQLDIVVERAEHDAARASVTLPRDRAIEVTLALPERKLQPNDAKQSSNSDRGSALSQIKPASWWLIGAGMGGFLAAGAFELSRSSSIEEAQRAPTAVDAAAARGAADVKRSMAMVSFGVGGGLTIAGAILAVTNMQADSEETAPAVAVACDTQFCGALASGRF